MKGSIGINEVVSLHRGSHPATQCQGGHLAEVLVGSDEDSLKSQFAFYKIGQGEFNVSTYRHTDVTTTKPQQSATEFDGGVRSDEVHHHPSAICVTVQVLGMVRGGRPKLQRKGSSIGVNVNGNNRCRRNGTKNLHCKMPETADSEEYCDITSPKLR